MNLDLDKVLALLKERRKPVMGIGRPSDSDLRNIGYNQAMDEIEILLSQSGKASDSATQSNN